MPLANATPFDSMIARNAGPIPQEYLRALAYRESSFRPDNVHPTSHATGLFQITKTALQSFNQRNATSFALPHLVNPELNTKVAVQHLSSILNVFKTHPSLAPDWSSPRWVALLTLGWNAGHNALAKIAQKMEAAGIPPEKINVDTVSQVAASQGPNARFVAEPGRASWAKSVAALFLGPPKQVSPPTLARQGAPPPPVALQASMVPSGGGGKVVLGVVALGAIAYAFSNMGVER